MTLPNPFPNNEKFTKAGNKGALIVAVLDKSTSMHGFRHETIKGYNAFMNEQRSDDALATLVLFNTSYHYVFKNRPSKLVYDIDETVYSPNGSTALLDALGAAITDTDTYLASLKEEDRPTVVFLVMTDGEENSSVSEFKVPGKIKQMISARQEAGWAFTFLGANIDAFQAASAYGINVNNAAAYNQNATAETFVTASAATTRYRSAARKGLVGAELNSTMNYSEQERSVMNGDNK